ncbi:MAG: hypothetical protein SGILL_008289 [Bacillariaceae sp.]
MQQPTTKKPPRASFYKVAKIVPYDVPAIFVDRDEFHDQLVTLWKADLAFHSKLKDEENPTLYWSYRDQLDHYKDPIVFHTWQAKEIVASLRSRAEFEILQLRRFTHNLPWIKSSLRAQILQEIHNGIDWIWGCLTMYKHFSEAIPKLMGRLRRIRSFDIDISVPEINVIPMDEEEMIVETTQRSGLPK